MIWLILGVLLWSAAHLLPCSGHGLRKRLIGSLGEGPYKGLFALTIVASVVLMVIGWRGSAPQLLYGTPTWSALVTNLLMLTSLVLFVASGAPTNLKRILRHPQLTGVAVWAGAHLLANGDLRSIVLFGGLGLWAVTAMAVLNRRDGPWQKPARRPLTADLVPVVGGVVGFVLLFLAHPYFSGVSPAPH